MGGDAPKRGGFLRLFTLRVRDWVAMLRKTRPQTAPRTRFLRSFHRFWVVILRKIIGFPAVILGGDAPNYLQQVMLDSDLAMLYGVKTGRLNEQVKRNINRFPGDFMFQLTAEESRNLKSQFAISSWGGARSRPYVFTRNGIAMLSSVLHSDIAAGVNIRIMRAFTMIPQLVNYNAQLVHRIFNIEQHQQETDEKIDMIIEKISPKPLPEQVFPTGCVWDAWTYVSDLVRSARQRIVLIDNFVDDRVLSMFTKRSDGVSATIHTRYNEQFLTDLNKHNTQYPKIEYVQLPQRNHDRFLIVDDKLYLLGASLKDIGTGLCAVTEMAIAPEVILELVKH